MEENIGFSEEEYEESHEGYESNYDSGHYFEGSNIIIDLNILEIDNINSTKDFEAVLPDLIHNNIQITIFNIYTHEEIINFDTKPLKEALKGRYFEKVKIIFSLRSYGSGDLGLNIIDLLECFEESVLDCLTIENFFLGDNTFSKIASFKKLKELSIENSIIMKEIQSIYKFNFRSLFIGYPSFEDISDFYKIIDSITDC